MIRKNTKLITAITFLVALFAVSACVFFFHIIRNKNRHASAVANALYSRIEYVENKDFYEAKNKELRATEDSIDTHLLDPEHVDGFTDYLEVLASESKASLSVASIEDSSNPHSIVVNVSVVGELNTIVRTLERIENAPYQIRVVSAYFNKETEGKAKEKNWRADISLEVITK